MTIARTIDLSRATMPAFAANGIFWGSFAAYVPEIKAFLGASDSQFAFALLVSSIGAILAMMLAARFETWLGPKAMCVAVLIGAVMIQPPFWTESIILFGALMFFVGASSGLYDVVMNARLSRIEAATGAPLMSFNHGFFSVAYACAAISAGLARDAGVPPHVIVAIIGVIFVGLALAARERRRFGTEEVTVESGIRGRLPLFVYVGGAITFIAFMAENAVEGWSALHLERTLGGSATEGALGPAMLGITMAVGRMSGQALVMRYGALRVLTIAALMGAAGAMIAGLAPVRVVAVAGFALTGFGISVIVPLAFALVGERAEARDRGRAIARASAVGYIGFFVGPPMMGMVSELTSLRISFLLIGLALAALPVLLRWLR